MSDRYGPLRDLGISDRAAQLYDCLLGQPSACDANVLSAATGLSVPQCTKALRELSQRGFAVETVSRRVRTFAAVPPAVAVASAVSVMSERASRATFSIPALTEKFWAGRAVGEQAAFLELVKGRHDGLARWMQLDRLAKDQVCAFDRPPYILSPAEPNSHEIATLRRGVRYRVVYSQEAIEMPGRWAVIQHELDAGEDARVTAALPAKLTLFDDFAGILSLSAETTESPALLMIIHPSPLLDALRLLFEAVWSSSVPMTVAKPVDARIPTEPRAAGLVGVDTAIAGLLAAGMSDLAIQRQLNVSGSTVQRRVRALLASLGARSRFQAGFVLGRAHSVRGLDDLERGG